METPEPLAKLQEQKLPDQVQQQLKWKLLFERVSDIVYVLSLWTIFVFVFGYVVVLMIILGLGEKEYPSDLGTVGFYIHGVTGGIFFLIGILQFHNSFRRDYPKIHRLFGLVYYVMTLLTSFGVILLLAGGATARESSILVTLTVLPFWLFMNWEAYVAIKKGDVDRHYRMNVRGFVIGFSIISTRPAMFVFIALFNPPVITKGEILKVTIWWTFSWFVIGCEAFLYLRKRLQSGPILVNGNAVIPLETDFVNGSKIYRATVKKLKKLNERTILMSLSLTDYPVTFIQQLAGQHVSLTCTVNGESVTRPYTRIPSADDRIDLVIRLVPNGAMSKLLKALVDQKLNSKGLFEVAVLAGHFDYYPNQYPHICMIAAGTGLTSMLNIMQVILNNPMDRTKIKLYFLNRDQKDQFLVEYLDIWKLGSKGRFDWQPCFKNEFNLENILKETPINTKVLISGPPLFVKSAHHTCMAHVGKEHVYSFGYSDR